jgi:hypothetical protein
MVNILDIHFLLERFFCFIAAKVSGDLDEQNRRTAEFKLAMVIRKTKLIISSFVRSIHLGMA